MQKMSSIYECLLWLFLVMGIVGYFLDNTLSDSEKPNIAPIENDANKQQRLNERLIAVCKNNKLSAMDILELKNADINYRDKDGKTPLMYAAANCLPSSIKLLIHQGADVNAEDNDGNNILVYASHSGHVDNTETLIASKQLNCDELFIHECLEYAKLLVSSYRDTRGYLQTVAPNRADINKISLHNMTPLMTAAYYGQNASIAILLEKGASLDGTNHNAETPLFWAITAQKMQTVMYLLEIGANVNITNKNNRTPLYYAVHHQNEKIVKMLLERGAKVDKRTLRLAMKKKNKKIVEILQNTNE